MNNHQRELHQLVNEVVQSLLADNPEVSALAKTAISEGIDEAEVKAALGRAFLACYWYAVKEGYPLEADPNQVVAERFNVELKRKGGGT